MRYSLLIFTFLIVALASGCTVTPLGLSDASTPLDGTNGEPRSYQVLGKAEGSQGYFSLFGLIPFGNSDFRAAMDDATKKLNGDALINVRYWYRVSDYFVGTYSSIEVQGDVIKFRQK
jgi:hypothetical protein